MKKVVRIIGWVMLYSSIPVLISSCSTTGDTIYSSYLKAGATPEQAIKVANIGMLVSIIFSLIYFFIGYKLHKLGVKKEKVGEEK